MRFISRLLALAISFLLTASMLLFPHIASADDSAKTRMFVFYETYGTQLFRLYAESIYDSFDCNEKTILSTVDYGCVLSGMFNYFSEADSNDVNLIVIQTHGRSDGAICFTTNPDDSVLCSPEAFRSFCDCLPGKTVIITGQCYGGEFAKKFWVAGTGAEYAEEHYAIYAVSGADLGYMGQTAVFMFPFGKMLWSDYSHSINRFGSDACQLMVAPLDANSDGSVTVRELYDYSSVLQYNFAKYSYATRSKSAGEDKLGYAYPELYGSQCLDLPIFKK